MDNSLLSMMAVLKWGFDLVDLSDVLGVLGDYHTRCVAMAWFLGHSAGIEAQNLFPICLGVDLISTSCGRWFTLVSGLPEVGRQVRYCISLVICAGLWLVVGPGDMQGVVLYMTLLFFALLALGKPSFCTAYDEIGSGNVIKVVSFTILPVWVWLFNRALPELPWERL